MSNLKQRVHPLLMFDLRSMIIIAILFISILVITSLTMGNQEQEGHTWDTYNARQATVKAGGR